VPEHLVGMADLSPAAARTNLARVGWSDAQTRALSLDAALKSGATHIGEDWRTLEHCLHAFAHGKHVVNVTVEADAFCGPLLARRASDAGVVYSLAFGDLPLGNSVVAQRLRRRAFSPATGR